MVRMKHVALVAPMHSGKTTLANLLVERGYTRIALADELKDIAAGLLNAFVLAYAPELPALIKIDRQEIENNKEVYRPFLQWFGSDFVRHHLLAESFWLDRFKDRFHNTELPVVCDDVRFPNEAFALSALGFEIVRLIRPEEDRLASIVSNSSEGARTALSHASETECARITADRTVGLPDLAAVRDLADRLAAESRGAVLGISRGRETPRNHRAA
jgi:hypothetical protein